MFRERWLFYTNKEEELVSVTWDVLLRMMSDVEVNFPELSVVYYSICFLLFLLFYLTVSQEKEFSLVTWMVLL